MKPGDLASLGPRSRSAAAILTFAFCLGDARPLSLQHDVSLELRDGINALFEQLKDVRKKVNSEFMEVSQGVYDKFAKTLDEIEERIAQGGSKFNSVFDELKKMQREYYNSRMSNEHRNKLWERLDAAFKKAKER